LFDKVSGLKAGGNLAALMAQLHDNVVPLNGRVHGLDFGNSNGPTFFDVDVFAGIARVDYHRCVPEIGRGNDYRVHGRVRYQLTIVQIGPHIRVLAPFDTLFDVRLVNIAHGDNPDTFCCSDVFDKFAAADADTYATHADSLVG
jgi:hypothetical protein